MRMRLLLAAYILFFVVVAAAEILPEDEKCLDIPDVTPKKYFHLKGKSLAIKLETSKRITHRLTTELFYIFIKEVLGYSKIEVNVREDDFQIEPVIERLSDYYHQTVSEPPATINLEVWVRPDYDTTNASQFVDECGTVGPPGRFGWFIPLEAARPVRTYYAKHLMSQNMFEVHWSLFLDPNLVRYFDISDRVISAMVKNENYNRRQDTGDYVCSESLCKESMYVPEQCRNTTCATLLAPGFNVSSFLVDQIDEMKLLVKVLWLGDNLRIVVEELSNLYALSRSNNSVVFFHWYPSEMVIDQRDFVSVLFTNNEIMEFTHKEAVGYKYEMHRLVKLAWSKIQKNAQPLYDSLRFFKLKESDYVNLLYLYEEYRANWPMRSIACNWMRNHTNVWKNWLGLYQTFRTPIYIGGIFPVNATSYNGKGIVTGAVMAQTAINKNPSILAHYNLQLIAFDGKCEADTVMKKFIDFIVEGYYPQLVGVLGPACSETVEPLAGVSRHYHIMVISYSAEGASFSDRTKYPYFFRTIGENKHYKHVYLKLFQRFGWKRVAALTEDGQKYTEYISLMQDDLEKNNIKFIANKKFPRERETEAMTRYLKDLKSKRARIIIADVVDDIARVVMCEAYKLEMTSAQGYVWFLPIWLNNTWYNTDQFNRNQKETVNCTSDEMKKAINGYFAMTHAYFAPDNAVMQENITVGQWRENYAKRTREPSNYAGFAYDAVWTYALALDKLAKTDPEAMSDLHSETTTNKLVRLVEDTDFHGVSGRIKFRGGPSRFSVIDVMQWYSDSMHTVGHFHPSLSENKPEILGGVLWLNESAVKWFTPDRAVPDDGTPPPEVCTAEFMAKLFNVSCQTAMIIANIMLVILLTLVLVAVCFYMKKKYERKVEQTKNYIRALGFAFDINNTCDLDKWEIPRESVVINRKLGEGAFGTVYGGEANLLDTGWCAVAVKTLKLGSTTEEKLDFLSEAEVMKRFDHPNVIKLLGVCTKEEPIYTIMEFMLYGDLKTYLLARRNLVNQNSEEVSSKQLTSMALDVARGLSYLADLKYVHRDIASRNCLVNAKRCVKLADFGMTRAMFDNDYYKFTRRGMLPVRWMAPESLEHGVFTPHSDVWSYGILLYEIITFGSFPFQGKSNAQVLELVKQGHTLKIPDGVKPELAVLIKSCWVKEPKDRHKASEIVAFLANNPKVVEPCLDAPLASVQLEDSNQAELGLPTEFREFRKSSTSSKSSPVKPNVTIEMEPVLPLYQPVDEKSDLENVPIEQSHVKEPLLGPGKPSSGSRLNLGKLVTGKQPKWDEENQDCPSSPEDGTS